MTNAKPSWEEIKTAVAEAMELAPTERASFLELRCAGNEAVLREAAALVEAASADDGFLSRRVDTWLGVSVPAPASLAGHRIGRYSLVRVLGEGASGVVYLAEQENPARTVALKVVRSPLPLVDVSDRFRLEAAALGRIRHPNVAQIYEAGVHRTETGAALPYLAMEYVEGEPITTHAKRASLGIRGILSLMIRVCGAVQAAHQRAVIHRDLKPSNVLVDAQGEPKVLDFGIARINEDGFRTRMTAAGSLLGTPGYMSPERFVSDGVDADVRTDVWSLGAMLYELLAGRPPMEVPGATPHAALRRLAEADVPPIRKFVPTIGRDLECVVMTALAHDREARYPSAQALADDLRRVHTGEAISVRPPGRAERALRFVRRHRVGVAIATIFAAVLIASSVTMGVLSQHAAKERDRARAVVGLLKGMISETDPNFGTRNVTMLAALESLESKIAGELGTQPRTEADVRSAMGVMLFAIAEYERAREHLERAIELRQGLGDHAARLEDQVQLANALRWLYLPEEARALIDRTKQESQRRLGRLHRTTIHASEVLAGTAHDEGRLADAESAYRDVIADASRVLGSDHEQTLFARSGLASVLIDAGRYAEAEAELRDVIARREAMNPGGARESLTLRANLALTLAEQGKLEEATREQRRLTDESARILGPLHDSTVTARMNLAESLRRAGESDEALAINQSLLDECVGALGYAHESTIDAVEAVAMNLVRLERSVDAEKIAVHALSAMTPTLGESSDAVQRLRAVHASALASLGRLNEAIEIYTTAIGHYEAKYGSESTQALVWTNNLGLALADAGRAGDAVALYRDLLARTEGRFDSMRPVFRRNLGRAIIEVGELDLAQRELTEARRLSIERGEADNAQRCEALLNRIEELRTGQRE